MRNSSRGALVPLLGIIAIALLAPRACTDGDGARRALQNAGFKNIVTKGYAYLGCSKDDMFHTKFTAVNAEGKTVTGVVCGGWFKGSTIRFD